MTATIETLAEKMGATREEIAQWLRCEESKAEVIEEFKGVALDLRWDSKELMCKIAEGMIEYENGQMSSHRRASIRRQYIRLRNTSGHNIS